MKIYNEINSFNNFNFWSGAKDTVAELDDDELNTIFSMLEAEEPEEGYSETGINDFFWFENDTIAEWLGYDNWEKMLIIKEKECDGYCGYCTNYKCPENLNTKEDDENEDDENEDENNE